VKNAVGSNFKFAKICTKKRSAWDPHKELNATALRNVQNALPKLVVNNHSLDIGPLKHMDERVGMTIFLKFFGK